MNACGLSGCDWNLLQADRREGRDIDWGYVGDVRQVNMGALELLLQAGVIPVIAPITHDGKGVLLNSNADGIAAAVAETLGRCYD
ncbi:UNVERIFIED_CONTAM: acetylglutamate kinase, partial [Bacteroidetes bacterium 56_B9]